MLKGLVSAWGIAPTQPASLYMNLKVETSLSPPTQRIIRFEEGGSGIALTFDSRMSWQDVCAMFAGAASALATQLAKQEKQKLVRS